MKKIYSTILLINVITIVTAQTYDVLNYNYNGVPAYGVKIKTNLPFLNGSQMPTLRIEGYNYGTAQTIGLSLVWYIYGGQFYSPSISSWGSYLPNVYLASENGNVTIYISDRPYYQRFKITAFAQGMSETASWFQGWTTADEPLNGANQVLVPYANSFSGTVRMPNGVWNANGNVGLGVANPGQPLEVEKDQDAGTFAIVRNTASSTSAYTGISANAQNQTVTLTASSDGFARQYPGFHSSAVSLIGGAMNGLNIISNSGAGTPGPNTGTIRFITYAAAGGVTSTGAGNDAFTRMVIDGSGKVGIGTISPSEKLSVNGNIKTQKLIVTQTGWSDYVFDKDYKLGSLQSLKTYISQNKHLPEVPSAKEVEEKGISVGDNQALLLKKIEELTLYVIKQQNQIDNEAREIQKLKRQISRK